MNRREALAALVSLPAATRITKADMKPTDVIVVECDAPLNQAGINRIREQIEQVWPGQKAVILHGGLTLKVVAGS